MSFFDTAYEGRPPWDLGRPQRAIVELAEAGRIVGSVLDIGCGTGEHALYLAASGHDVVGVDLAPRAIDLARAKVAERGIAVDLRVWDALRIDELGRTFDTALDVGMFHTLSDEERPRYARALHTTLAPGGHAFILCWSERNAWGFGPRRVTQMELRGTFERGWNIRIRGSELESRLEDATIHAWLCELGRIEPREV
ncbi:MAG TPA: class I SAM-dependent methyltransferase [Actinomycetota bacterium]|nr:class I SAM-dependent methyltransferase [Actinomycetota bacterium]